MITADLSVWEFSNIVFRACIVLVVVVKLAGFWNTYRLGQRIGLGLIGGCALMTIPVILDGPASPFAEWAGAVFSFGVLAYAGGGLLRNLKHSRANQQQIAHAKAHLGGRK